MTAFHDDERGRHLTAEQIAEYRPYATVTARHDLKDRTQELFAQAGVLVHIAKVELSDPDHATILLHCDNGVDGPDESRVLDISGDWATIAATIEVLINLNTLDEWPEDELDQIIGRQADWHGTPFPIVPFLGSIAIQVILPCARCGKNPDTVYARSGCHHGAFCYVYDQHGTFLADLRNQEYVCSECQERRQQTIDATVAI